MAEDNDSQNGVEEELGEVIEKEGSGLATTLVAGVAIAVLAPELLPGMAIGVAALLAPKILPRLGFAVRPLVKSAVRAGYAAAAATREMVAEAGEQVQDMVAEARAEQDNGGTAKKGRRTRKQPAKRRHAHA